MSPAEGNAADATSAWRARDAHHAAYASLEPEPGARGIGAAPHLNCGLVRAAPHPKLARGPLRRWPYPREATLVLTTVDGVDLAHKTVLEVGCGRGGNLAVVGLAEPTARCFGLDITLHSLTFARSLRGSRGVRGVVHADAAALPTRPQSADVLLSIESSHSYGDLAYFYRDVARSLRSEGVFCYADCFPKAAFAVLPEALLSCGLEPLRVESISEGVADSRDVAWSEWLERQSRGELGRVGSAIEPGGWLWKMIGAPGSPAYQGWRDGSLVYFSLAARRAPSGEASAVRPAVARALADVLPEMTRRVGLA